MKSMKRKIACLGMCIALTTALCGCGNDYKVAKGPVESTTEEATETTVEDTTKKEAEESKEAVESQTVQEEMTEPESGKSGNVVVDIPEEFREYLPPSGIYVTEKYPEDGTNIYIVTAPLYGELPDEKGYKREINENISSQVGVKVEINLLEYEKTTVDGCDAIRAVYTYSYDGMNFKRLEYTVNTDITTTIAYTQVGDHDWMETFEESALTMYIE